MYGECWFTGQFYFKHGGSQNATLKGVPLTPLLPNPIPVKDSYTVCKVVFTVAVAWFK